MGYGELEIADGGAASAELERLMFDGAMAAKERAELREALLAYCRTATMAMVRLVERLRAMSG